MENLVDEFIERRTCCCRHCWGEQKENGGREYQFTPAEYKRAALSHAENRDRILKDPGQTVDIGEFPAAEGDWYDKRKAPNTDCPECSGRGIESMLLRDTRTLSPEARAAYGGVRKIEGGIALVFYENGARREVVIS